MVNDGLLKPCQYYVVRYVPSAEREEFLNIGLLLHSPEEQFLDCLFSRDFRRVKRFHSQADTGFLRELQSYFEQQIQQHEDNLPGFLGELQESLSNLIQLAPSRAVLASDPQALLPQLFEGLVDKLQVELPAADTRMRIKQRLAAALRRVQIFNDRRLEKHIPAERLTHPGNPFHFDFGYRPALSEGKPNGHLKLIHALSLRRDPELASVLSVTMGYVRSQQPAELTAVIEGWPARDDKIAVHSYRILKDAQIAMWPLAQVDELAASVRNQLAWSQEASF